MKLKALAGWAGDGRNCPWRCRHWWTPLLCFPPNIASTGGRALIWVSSHSIIPTALLKPKALLLVVLPHSLAGAGVKTDTCTYKALSCCIAETCGCMQSSHFLMPF